MKVGTNVAAYSMIKVSTTPVSTASYRRDPTRYTGHLVKQLQINVITLVHPLPGLNMDVPP